MVLNITWVRMYFLDKDAIFGVGSDCIHSPCWYFSNLLWFFRGIGESGDGIGRLIKEGIDFVQVCFGFGGLTKLDEKKS